MIDFLVGLLGNLLAGELAAWGPRLADKIISCAASKLSPELKERMLEEWRALLADTPGDFLKVMTAISLFRSRYKIRDEFQAEYPRSSTFSSLRTLLALTPQELSVVEWLGKGNTNREISRILGVSEQTIRFHVESIFLKLDVTSRTQAVACVLERRSWKPNTNQYFFSHRPIWEALRRLLLTIQAVITYRLKHGLTKLEFSVLLLLASGRSNSEMAVILGVSHEAVCSHLKSIFSKLPTKSRVEALSSLLKYKILWLP